MSVFRAMWCVIGGHEVSLDYQKELIKSWKKIDAECKRCGYPLTIEPDNSDKTHFYYTEQPSHRSDIPKIKL